MSRQAATQTLVESFCALADEVQNLTDRKTILEHKLRFAAEQYQQLADKYAPTASEVSETLANLQVPPVERKPSISSSYVPLPKRGLAGCDQHQVALLIRDGRRAAQQLAAHNKGRVERVDRRRHSNNSRHDLDGLGSGGSSKETSSGTAITTMSIIMEQDFTVEGKKGMLACPFSAVKREQQLLRQKQQLDQENQRLHLTDSCGSENAEKYGHAETADVVNTIPADSKTPKTNSMGGDKAPLHEDDPICMAMADEGSCRRASSSGGGAAARCPIRFLDQHSPEEIAHYVETHKHELPRSHSICLRRYNKNEEEIRKMDAKYGSMVNMISSLGQFHQPMLASAEPGPGGTENGISRGGGVRNAQEAIDRAEMHKSSHDRVKSWAKGVSISGADNVGELDDDKDVVDTGGSPNDPDGAPRGRRHSSAYSGGGESSGSGVDISDPERESHFDRPLKEVRLGESPSRPWGIAIPVSSMSRTTMAQPPFSPPAAPVRMMSPARAPVHSPPISPTKPTQQEMPVRRCPFGNFGLGITPPPGHAPIHDVDGVSPLERESAVAAEATPRPDAGLSKTPPPEPSFTVPKAPSPQPPPQAESKPQAQTFTQPAFVNFPLQTPAQAGANAGSLTGSTPQMVFTGPVFIGYPMEQAAQFMRMYNNS
ncbi:hypothetical protein SEPCBS119000_002400 [Sporothrix epigloea]|uniref:Uncharacterized protein n=1 Tax=Sporothrix epigloea TaxID=1892477 RepID=A0ABP0DIQ7_9PEZI